MSTGPNNREASNKRLQQLKDFFAAAADNTRSAQDYIQFCLHEPEFGYYASKAALGRSGDFATNATLSPQFAECIAKWIEQRAPARGAFVLVEFGPGDGSLAAGILKTLKKRTRRRCRFLLLEQSAHLRAQLNERFQDHAVCVLSHPNELIKAAQKYAKPLLCYSNEFVDAFAPQVLQWQGKSWHKLALKAQFSGQSMQLAECSLELQAAELEALKSLTTEPTAWPEQRPVLHQRVEIPASYCNWLRSWLPQLLQSPQHCSCASRYPVTMLTIDYGAPFPELYAQKPRGTLRSYLRHERVAGANVWRRPGLQDITFDVNFSDLYHWHAALGAKEQRLLSLKQWAQKRQQAPKSQRMQRLWKSLFVPTPNDLSPTHSNLIPTNPPNSLSQSGEYFQVLESHFSPVLKPKAK